jgi:hypothetical protein
VNDAFGLEDFDRYIEEHGISEEDYPAAFAVWLAEMTGESKCRDQERNDDEDPNEDGRQRHG